MKNVNIRHLALTGVFTALIFVFTAFVHIPSYTGYVHIGDGFIYLIATLLPTPYALFAAVFGAGLADVLTGYAIWAPATVIIKAVTVLFFTYKTPKILCRRNLIALVPSAALCVIGYYLYEIILYGNALTPLYGMIGNATQAAFSSAVFVLISLALTKVKFKDLLAGERKISH